MTQTQAQYNNYIKELQNGLNAANRGVANGLHFALGQVPDTLINAVNNTVNYLPYRAVNYLKEKFPADSTGHFFFDDLSQQYKPQNRKYLSRLTGWMKEQAHKKSYNTTDVNQSKLYDTVQDVNSVTSALPFLAATGGTRVTPGKGFNGTA